MKIETGLAMLAFGSAAAAAPPSAEAWRVVPPAAEHPLELTYEEGGNVVYRLSCGPDAVAVSQYGVTKLLDIQTGKTIGDEPGSAITPGASVMALAAGKGDPRMVSASATANPAKGWDMTIRLRKDDPAVLALARTEMVSLFTTGYTRAVMIGKDDRKRLAAFVSQCRG